MISGLSFVKDFIIRIGQINLKLSFIDVVIESFLFIVVMKDNSKLF